jgi:hypothetical protein
MEALFMNMHFCADDSRNSKEDIIGSAPGNGVYVLIECPSPWTEDAFNSKSIPDSLRNLKDKLREDKVPITLLLVNQKNSDKQTKSIIFFKKNDGLSKHYSRWEVEIKNLEAAASLIKDYLNQASSMDSNFNPSTRDILVCTHGSHDKCCAKYGIPFYRQALVTLEDAQLTNIRIWQASHFGGHRFAPTIIDFPEGRCYGALDQNTFRSIMTRTGDISCMKKVYRGWGILSIYAQMLERELMLRHGWEWFNFNVESKIISQNEDRTFNHVELTYKNSANILHSCTADVLKDESKTIYLKGSCNGKELERAKFRLENVVFS